MKKSWMLDAVLGLVLSITVVAFAYFKISFTETLESRLYDLRLKYSPKSALSDQILLVAIDDTSIASVGRWPWPRAVIGQLIRAIAQGAPKVIGVNILYVDPDQNQGLEVVRQIKEEYDNLLTQRKDAWGNLFSQVNKDARYKKITKTEPLSLDPFRSMIDLFGEAEQALDNDSQLAQTLMETPGVVLPSFFSVDKPLAEEGGETLDRMKGYALTKVQDGPRPSIVLEGYQPLLPLPEFASGASGFGHSNIFADPDGSVRQETLFVKYKEHYFPSLSLEMARIASGLNPEDIQITTGKEIVLGSKRIPLNEDNRLYINYQGTFSSLKTVSAVDILAEKIQPEAFKDKLVLLGTMATGIGTLFVVPVEPTFPANGVIVTVLQNILGENFITRPDWVVWVEFGTLGLVALFVTLLLPHMKAKWGALVAVLMLLAIAGTGVYFFVAKGYWIKIFYGMALLVLAYALVTVRRFFFTERRKELVEAESIETNKMLGLSFQGQGMLDLAFEKFRKCPVDDAMKELLYNLALDFERKRQFNKAAVVYDHISKADAGYKDIKDRQKSCKAAAEGGVVTSIGGGKADGTIVMGGASAKPTLGRYEIEKELGRGAMGIVYLGKDPKINRQVAIKTLKFDDDVDEATGKQLKERFFREAESAGTLNHPHIVRIFDAGEDNEICYIAMELLSGEDLKKYGEKANLLPPDQVIEYVAQVADALDYAHAAGIVHRDIKPANIMRLKDGTLRVTDFGIARITGSSKTQTGTVMGTPSYMSPEQIAGKKVDGRADLFSLGVMLYELMTGEKPFEGDSIATLLFKISSEVHPDPIIKASQRVTPAIKAVIDKALQKSPDVRYQRGRDMAADLREALKSPSAKPQNSAISSAGLSPSGPASVQSAGDTVRLASPVAPSPTDTVKMPAPAADTVKLPASNLAPSDTVQLPPSVKGSSPDGTLKL